MGSPDSARGLTLPAPPPSSPEQAGAGAHDRPVSRMLCPMKNAPQVSHNHWTQGNVASWVAGVTLGGLIGLGLLIGVPRLAMPATAPATASTAGGEVTPADAPAATTTGGSTPGGAGSAAPSGSGEASGGTANAGAANAGTGSAETGNAGAGSAAGGEMGAAGQNAGGGASAAGASEGAAGAAGASAESPTNANEAAGTTPNTKGGGESAGNAGAGETLFASNCAGCHGQQAGGGIGPSLVTAEGPKAWSDAEFLTTLREGKTPQRTLNATMPRYSQAQLSDAQVYDLHAYLKGLN